MKLSVLSRRLHYYTAIIAGLPVLVILTTGLLLQAKKHWSWVQPAELRGTGASPAISLDSILASSGAGSWSEVNRIDLRPARGVAKVWLMTGYEVQVDLGTGAVLQSAYRRSDLIESIHDGSWFGGNWTKLGLFLPAGAALLLLWCTGLVMFIVTFNARRRRQLTVTQTRPIARL